jgi:hypothetical protein
LAHRVISLLRGDRRFRDTADIDFDASRRRFFVYMPNPTHGPICPTGAIREFLSSCARKNISVFQKVESVVCFAHPASLAEGRIAIVTTREAGMRWTWRR